MDAGWPELGEAGAGVRRRGAVALAGASAAALYVAACTSAIAVSYSDRGAGEVILAGLANTLPDVLAAPLALRAATAPGARRLALAGLLFVAWGFLASGLAFAALRAARSGVFTLAVDVRPLAWKALLSLLVFGVLSGAGLARRNAREARAAATRALRAEALGAESRLAVLRAQLNPHFILNVLHSLVGLAERDPRATASALERLGTTLRYAQRAMSRRSDRVVLRDELDFTREYLELERLRLGERLEVHLEVDEALLGRVVPPFVLQPLVENAIRHAVAPRARGGVVRIGITGKRDALVLTVEDDGEERTAATPRPGEPSGLGLGLLRDRLEALYQGGASVALDRSTLGGVRATVRLRGEPWSPEEAELA